MAETSGDALVLHEDLAELASADEHLAQALRHLAEALRGAIHDGLRGQRGEQGLLGGLPHHGIAAHQGERRVPRPHGDRKIERRDDAADAQRVPGLHHPVLGALGGDGEAVELAGEADGEVADVDHLLDLAEPLGGDLAGLEGDEAAEIVLGGAQFLAEEAHELAAPRRGDFPPRLEGLMGRGDGLAGLLRRGLAQGRQNLAGDGRARGMTAIGERGVGHAQAREYGAGLLGHGGGYAGYRLQGGGFADGHGNLPGLRIGLA